MAITTMTILLADGKVQSIKPQDLGLLRKGKGGSNLHLWTGCLSKADLKSAEHDPSLSCTTTMPRCTFVGVYYRVGLACSRALFISTVISSAAAIRPSASPSSSQEPCLLIRLCLVRLGTLIIHCLYFPRPFL